MSNKCIVKVCIFWTLILPPAFVLGLVLPSAIRQRRCAATRVFPNDEAAGSDGDIETSEIGDPVDLLADCASVLFESNRILAVDKPEGIPHHDGEDELGIPSLLRQAQAHGKLDYKGRLYGVHRLDRVTSGILLLAKDAEMASTLTRAFREGNVTKH